MKSILTCSLLIFSVGLSTLGFGNPSINSPHKKNWLCLPDSDKEENIKIELTTLEPIPVLEIIEGGGHCTSFATVSWRDKWNFKTLTIFCELDRYEIDVDKDWNLVKARVLYSNSGYFHFYKCGEI